MYNKKAKCWTTGYDAELLKWCQEPENRDNPDAMFILADAYLEEGSKGHHTADAVYMMERAAGMGYPQAMLAMGQMLQYGWGVHKHQKTAMYWYETAAKHGNPEAAEYLRQLRQRRIRQIVAGSVLVGCGAVLLAAVLLFPSLFGILPNGVRVNKDTELILPTTSRDFAAALGQLITAHDTDLVISGQQSTNRLVLRFTGSGIDLSAFPAATVIADEDGQYVIIQFTSEEEAGKCLETLRQMRNVVFVETDSYGTTIETGGSTLAAAVAPVYTSPYTGYDYYTWGATFLELDKLAAWIATQPTRDVTVAVVDSGTQYHAEFGDRLLPGFDATDPSSSNGWGDVQGHGTHVAGTILDCTQGLDVYVLPVRVFIGRQTSSALIAAGILYAVDEQVDVINLSLGVGCNGITEDAVRQALAQDIIVVASAGNESMNVDTYDICPAHVPGCITVSGCQSDINLYDSTNYGNSVDVCAPAVGIVSYCLDDMLASKNGTSMAAPHVSALTAMLEMYLPDKTPAQIEKYITDYCINPGDPLYYGGGIPLAGYFAGN